MRSVESHFCVIDHKSKPIEGSFVLIMCMYIYGQIGPNMSRYSLYTPY